MRSLLSRAVICCLHCLHRHYYHASHTHTLCTHTACSHTGAFNINLGARIPVKKAAPAPGTEDALSSSSNNLLANSGNNVNNNTTTTTTTNAPALTHTNSNPFEDEQGYEEG